MKGIASTFALLLILVASASHSETKNDPAQIEFQAVKDSVDLVNRGATGNSAKGKIKRFIKKHPDSEYVDDAYLLGSVFSLHRNDPKGAKKWLKKLIDKFPESDHLENAKIHLSTLETLLSDLKKSDANWYERGHQLRKVGRSLSASYTKGDHSPEKKQTPIIAKNPELTPSRKAIVTQKPIRNAKNNDDEEKVKRLAERSAYLNEIDKKLNSNKVVPDEMKPLAEKEKVLLKNAKSGTAESQYQLAKFYEEISQKHRNKAGAPLGDYHGWYKRAAKQGHPGGDLHLANYIMKNPSVVYQEKKRAEALYLKAGDAGYGEAYYKLYYHTKYGRFSTTKRHSDIGAFEYLEKAAESGHTHSQWLLGISYYSGEKHLDKNIRKSFKWFMASAKSGNSDSQWMVAKIHLENADDITLDKGPYHWIYKSANNKNEYALEFLCSINYQVKQYDEALHWCNKAIEIEIPKAYDTLSSMYRYGYGVEKDTVKGIRLLRKAAENGRSLSQALLATHLYNEKKNPNELKGHDSPLYWAKKANEQVKKDLENYEYHYLMRIKPKDGKVTVMAPQIYLYTVCKENSYFCEALDPSFIRWIDSRSN